MHDKVNIKKRQKSIIKIVPKAFMKRYQENSSNLLFEKISVIQNLFVCFFFFLTEDSKWYIFQIYGPTRVVWSIKAIPESSSNTDPASLVLNHSHKPF